MSELQSLLAQKENLAEQMRRISETCEGIENEENAAKVSALNEEQLKLSAQKSDLQGKLANLDRELVSVGNKIQELSGSGIEKILNAIKNQRWFFFKNKQKVLMDRDTALLWADLNYFPYGKNNNSASYSYSNNYSEVKNLIAQTNSQNFGGIGDWRIPTHFELWKMIEDKTFPFKEGNNWYIKNRAVWCVNYNGNIHGKDLDDSGASSDISDYSAGVIPCSSAFVPTDYEKNIAPVNKIYSEKEKLQMTLNIFVQNNLEPIFNDAKITELYRQIYFVKPDIQKKLSEVQQEIDKLNEVELISAKIDWLALKTKFDCGAEKSLLKYADSVKNLTEYLIEKFSEYTREKSEVLNELKEISEPNKLVPNVEKVFEDIENFLEEALTIKKSLLSVETLNSLSKAESTPPPTFDSVAEILTEKIRQVLLQVEFFELQPEFVKESCAALNLKFESNSEEFLHLDYLAQKFISDLILYVKEGHLQKKIGENGSTLAEILLENCQRYRRELFELYKNSSNKPNAEQISEKVDRRQKNFNEVLQMLDDENERRRLEGKFFRWKIREGKSF